MSIIAEALKKAQKRQNPNLLTETKTSKQPIFGPSPGYQKKEKKWSYTKKNNFVVGGLVFGILLLLSLTFIFSYIQTLQKTYIEIPATASFSFKKEVALPQVQKNKPLEEKELFKLSGIVQDESKPLAVINDRIVGPGEIVNGARVIEINDDSVKLVYKGKKIILYFSK
jgi:hypothetical protein